VGGGCYFSFLFEGLPWVSSATRRWWKGIGAGGLGGGRSVGGAL